MEQVFNDQEAHTPQDFFQSGPFFSRYKKYITACASVLLFFTVAWQAVRAPRDFPAPTIFSIPRGESLTSISESLSEQHLIRSTLLFQAFTILFSGDKNITAGDFAFESKVPVYEIAWRIAHADFGIARRRVTIPEGSTVKDIAGILTKQLINFSSDTFLAKAVMKEGYLFPDTYFFFSNAQPDVIIETLSANFDARIETIKQAVGSSKRSFADVVKMASILEREANKPADRRIVAGILWKRIDAGMRLQVDAPFFYIRQSGDKEVTQTDLTTDSPYNTYLHKGLPPTPIGNPGLDSIEAALAPEASAYWYYLYDAKGTIHYARTFDEHKANKARYLWGQ